MKKTVIRLTEADINNIVRSTVARMIKEASIRGDLGRFTMDDVDEELEAFKTSILGALHPDKRTGVYNFDDTVSSLRNVLGIKYVGPDEDLRCHVFESDDFMIYLYPDRFFPDQQLYKIGNLHLVRKKNDEE